VTLPTQPQLDHLVVLASSLAQGVAWCEASLGVTPGPGGEHPLMGTHNRLVSIASAAFPAAYLEIIAINSEAVHATPAREKRWFDMDNPALQAAVASLGPRLIHWVARTPDVQRAVRSLAAMGIDAGRVLEASRTTATGLLQWQITVRDDGQRLLDGCLPTLIQWGDVHPADNMAGSGVSLDAVQITSPQAGVLQMALGAIGVTQINATPGPSQINASLRTPKGLVQLSSLGPYPESSLNLV
jgi:Glyoxalase-like domain